MDFKLFEFRIVRNEFRKSVNAVSVVITIISIVSLLLLFGLFLKESSEEVDADATEQEKILLETLESTDDWKERYRIQMELNKTLEDVYGKDVVNMQNSLLQYKIDNEIAPGVNGNYSVDFVKYSFSTLGFILVIISSLIFTKILAIEYKNKTEKLIYTKPFSRVQVLLSKYIVAVLIMICSIVFWYLISMLIGGVLFGYEDFNAKSVVYYNNSIIEMTTIKESLINCLITFINALVCGSIAFFSCSISRSRLVGIGTGLVLFFAGKPVTQKLYNEGFVWVKYIPFSYTDFNIFMNQPIDASFKMINGVFLNILLIVILMVVSAIVLKKRDI